MSEINESNQVIYVRAFVTIETESTPHDQSESRIQHHCTTHYRLLWVFGLFSQDIKQKCVLEQQKSADQGGRVRNRRCSRLRRWRQTEWPPPPSPNTTPPVNIQQICKWVYGIIQWHHLEQLSERTFPWKETEEVEDAAPQGPFITSDPHVKHYWMIKGRTDEWMMNEWILNERYFVCCITCC